MDKRKIIYKSLLWILVFVIPESIYPQITPDTIWTKIFGGIGREQAVSVIQTFDNGYVIAGTTDSFGAGLMDCWVIKVDGNGNEIWEKTFGGQLNDAASSVKQTVDSGYVIAGFTESAGNGGRDVWLIRLDADGNEIWNRSFGGENNDLAQYVQLTAEDGFIITGSTQSFGNGNEDIWLINVDGMGNELWNKTFGGASWERAYTVHQTNDNSFVLAGRTESYGSGSIDAWLIKTNNSGNEIWNKTFGGTGAENAYSLQITSDGGYIMAGYTKSSGNGEEDIWLIKTDGNGNEIWNKKFGGSGNDVTYSVQQTTDSGYFISGFTNSFGAGEMDVWLIRTDNDGNLLWDQNYGGTFDDLAFCGQQTSEDGYIIAGSTYSYGNGQDDFYLIKLNSDGSTGTRLLSASEINNYRLMQNYPNPFNPKTRIEYEIIISGFISLKVFDVLGKEITTIVKEEKPAGKYEAEFDGSDLPSGIYYYQLQTSNIIKSRKMILLK